MERKVKTESNRRIGVNFINIYAPIFRTEFWHQSRNVSRKAAKKGRLYEKSERKKDDEIDGYIHVNPES